MKYPVKCSFALLCLLFFKISLSAQDKLPIKFGKVSLEDFNVTSPLIDSNTNAVVVADVGNSEFMANSSDLTFSLIFKEKKRIKIINKNGFDAATITIPLYVGSGGKTEKLEDLDAYTYNIENGKVVSTKVEKSSVFTEQHNKNWTYKKFTFPALKEGSIIEYSCQVKSDFFFNLQPWVFQGGYPVLWSQYDAGIPEFYKYVILSQGYQPFFINKVNQSVVSFTFVERTKAGDEAFRYNGASDLSKSFKIDGSIDYHSWVMRDVPGLKEEPFTTTIRNSIAKIEFQLNQVAFPHSPPQNYMDSWEKVSEDLMKNEDFGIPINKANNWLEDEVGNIVKAATTAKEKTKKIYEYIRDNYACKDNTGIHMSTGLKDVVKNKNGSVADINLLLIAMLRNQKIDANPVILSTRNHGFTHEFYPLMDRYNYVIAQVSIDNETFYLDATEPRLSFGKLPLELYNGHARIIAGGAMPVFFMADSLNEISNTMVFIDNNDTGGVEGNFISKPGYYHSLDIRNKLAKTTMEEYKKTLLESFPEDIELSSITIDSLKLLEQPLAIQCDMKLKAFGDADIVYFNPMLGEATKKNPFTAAERFYPVEMSYAIDDVYTFNMDIPKGYMVDELPKSARVMLNETEGMFEYLISASETSIQMRRRLLLKKANYSNEDYQTLRDFFGFIVSKEAEQIVFKKIK
jgi:Transglutaminase-like superfamily/Domain of Unknown Function with PDB structure (DUF3857)